MGFVGRVILVVGFEYWMLGGGFAARISIWYAFIELKS